MSNSSSQKLKLVYLMKILLDKTDETHSINMADILSELKSYGITAERKSIYTDMEVLRQYGMDIIGEQSDRTYYYHIGNRRFELAELKLLVDSVQAAKFITEKKSNELIKKIESFASEYEAKQLHRQVYVADRVKTMNESIYYNVDQLHQAIAENRQIRFQYFQWNVKKEMVLRHDGAFYEVSPWALSWDDENYYMVAYDNNADMIKHFRVDKMVNISVENRLRKGKEAFRDFNMAVYARKLFGMFDGEESEVKLLCENKFAGVMIDRFGRDVKLVKTDKEHFTVTVKVAVSNQFLGWVFALGSGVKIVAPEEVVEKMRIESVRLMNQYEINDTEKTM